MTNDEFYSLVMRKVRRASDTKLRSYAPDELRQQLQAWERGPFHPWFLEKTSVGLITVEGSLTLDVPDDFLLQVEDTKFRIYSDTGEYATLKRGYHEDLEDAFENEENDFPVVYDIFAGKIYLGPTPDGNYQLRLKYYGATEPPEDDSTEVSNPWIINAEDLAVTSVAARLVANYVKDMEFAQQLFTRASVLLSDLHKYNEARKAADMDYSVDR